MVMFCGLEFKFHVRKSTPQSLFVGHPGELAGPVPCRPCCSYATVPGKRKAMVIHRNHLKRFVANTVESVCAVILADGELDQDLDQLPLTPLLDQDGGQLTLGPQLSPKQREDVQQLLDDFQDTFSVTPRVADVASTQVASNKPIAIPYRPVPFKWKEMVEKEI